MPCFKNLHNILFSGKNFPSKTTWYYVPMINQNKQKNRENQNRVKTIKWINKEEGIIQDKLTQI